MLEAVKPKKIGILSYTVKENELVLDTENGKLKLVVVSDEIIRIVYTLEKEFVCGNGYGLEECREKEAKLSVTENEKEITLKTKALSVVIQKSNGRLVYKDINGKTLLQEPQKGGKYLIPYDSYKIDYSEEMKVERIMTPDGEKEVIT